MTRTIPLAAMLLALVALNPAEADDAPKKAKGDRAAHLFGPDKVWQVHITIPTRNWEVMQPKKAPFFFGGKPAEKPAGEQRGAFGYDFEYMPGDLEFDGKTYKDVGVRFKGNSTYMMSAGGLKRPFKIDIDRFTDDHDFHGLKMLNLGNNASDASQLREALGYIVFRAAGVPAPRTAFVELTLTVPGKHDREFVGLYTLIENIDKAFLNNHFPKHSKGMLVKPEGIQSLTYLGPDWQPYEDKYRPKKETDAKQQQRLREFVRLVNFADDAAFKDQIAKQLDMDLFLRYLAACAAMSNLDSFVGTGHNYFLYLNPRDDRFVMLPWDLNNALGNFGMMGSLEQQTEWTVKKPYLGSSRLTARVLAIPEYDAAYRKHLRDLIDQGFKPETLHATIDQLQKTIKPSLDKEAKAKRNDGAGMFGLMLGAAPPDLKKFVSQRAASVIAQLDGKAEGKEMRGAFAGARPANPANPAPVGPPPHPLTKAIFTAADLDKDGKLSADEAKAALERLFASCDTAKKGAIDEKAFNDGLTRLMPPRPAGFGFRPPGGGSSTATTLAGILFYRTTGENPLGGKDFVTFAEKLFRSSDKDNDGALDERELSAGLNGLTPPVPGFGPPPAPPAKAQAAGGQP